MFARWQRYLLSKPEACEDFPFGPDVAVYKIENKMFATLSVHDDHYAMNLKCEPTEAEMLRTVFDAVHPGYHMNKKHWNTVILDDSIPTEEIERMVDESYRLVVKTLNKALRARLAMLYSNADE